MTFTDPPRRAPLLATDKYKPVMARAGFPLRRETFVLSFRRGGPFHVPLDLTAWVRSLLPRVEEQDLAWLAAQGIPAGEAYRSALEGEVEVHALPVGAWFLAGEPLLSVTGPSALVSSLEATLVGVRFPIQIASLAHSSDPRDLERLATLTCEEERDVVLETLDALRVPAPRRLRVDAAGYASAVRARTRILLEALEDPTRLAEVGLRAATSPRQHVAALRAARDAGLVATSHLLGARELGLVPAGTTGHEHVQRWGADPAAFAAARDTLAGEVTYLLDTYSTLASGLPAALEALAAAPARRASVRLDCEATMDADLRATAAALEHAGLQAGIVLGGGIDAERVRHFEALRRELGLPPERVRYLVGQHLVAPHVPLPTRSEVSAVYKLSRTGERATMKFSDDPGKASLPGEAVVFRRLGGPRAGPFGIIGQAGEDVPEGYVLLDQERAADSWPRPEGGGPGERVALSPATSQLCNQLEAERTRSLHQPQGPSLSAATQH